MTRRWCLLLGVQVAKDGVLLLNPLPHKKPKLPAPSWADTLWATSLWMCSVRPAWMITASFGVCTLEAERWSKMGMTYKGVDTACLHSGNGSVKVPPRYVGVCVRELHYIYCIFNPVKYKWIVILNLHFKCIRLLMLLKEIPTNGIISGGFVCLF